MDRMRFSTIAHAAHKFCNPIGEAQITMMLDRLDLASNQRVIDIGCGKAELRARVLPPFEEIEIGEGRVTRARGIIGIDVRKKSSFTPLRLVHLNPMSEQAVADMWRIARFDLVARIDRNEPAGMSEK
jgi:hypothetical protein